MRYEYSVMSEKTSPTALKQDLRFKVNCVCTIVRKFIIVGMEKGCNASKIKYSMQRLFSSRWILPIKIASWCATLMPPSPGSSSWLAMRRGGRGSLITIFGLPYVLWPFFALNDKFHSITYNTFRRRVYISKCRFYIDSCAYVWSSHKQDVLILWGFVSLSAK